MSNFNYNNFQANYNQDNVYNKLKSQYDNSCFEDQLPYKKSGEQDFNSTGKINEISKPYEFNNYSKSGIKSENTNFNYYMTSESEPKKYNNEFSRNQFKESKNDDFTSFKNRSINLYENKYRTNNEEEYINKDVSKEKLSIINNETEIKSLHNSLNQLIICESKLRDQVIKKDKRIIELEKVNRENEENINKLKRINLDKESKIEELKYLNNESNINLRNLTDKVIFSNS